MAARLKQKEKFEKLDFGGVAQLGEHLPCKQGVKSSNLSVSISSLFNTKKAADVP